MQYSLYYLTFWSLIYLVFPYYLVEALLLEFWKVHEDKYFKLVLDLHGLFLFFKMWQQFCVTTLM